VQPRIHLCAFIPAVVLLPFVATAQDAPDSLGSLGGNSSVATAIRTCGEITGSSQTADLRMRAFRFTDATGLSEIPIPADAPHSDGQGINERGHIGGAVQGPEGGMRAVVFRHGEITDFGPGRVYDINNLGLAVGIVFPIPSRSQAAAWDAAGRVRWLLPESPVSSWAEAVNDRGEIVGTWVSSGGKRRAVLWEPTGEMLDLGTLGGLSAEALGINEAGDVVGIAETATGDSRAFLWRRSLGMLDIMPAATPSGAWAINDVGQVTGSWGDAAFVWSPETGIVTLLNLGPTGFSRGLDINDLGEVVGFSYDTTGSRVDAVRWVVPPAPERQLTALERAIDRLGDTGSLSRGQVTSLQSGVAAATRALERGDRDGAGRHLASLAQRLEREVERGAKGLEYPLALAERMAEEFGFAGQGQRMLGWCGGDR
jgi:probable HAF family extracellular repeat protein